MSTQNPLLRKIKLPGATCRLPSGGMFYTSGELSPDTMNGEVHVYAMTTIDEIIMKSPDKMFSGDAIKEVFSRCIPQIMKPGELSAKDVDYLLAFLRKVTYGDEFEVSYNHECTPESKPHNYVISIGEHLNRTKIVDPTSLDAMYHIELPNNQVVALRPARYDDMLSLQQSQLKYMNVPEITDEETMDMIVESMLALIKSVDGLDDRDMIGEWLRSIPVDWMKQITESIQSTTDWGIDITVQVVCKDCGQAITIAAPLNPVSFFI